MHLLCSNMSASACRRTRSETEEEGGLAANEIYISLNRGGSSLSGKQQGTRRRWCGLQPCSPPPLCLLSKLCWNELNPWMSISQCTKPRNHLMDEKLYPLWFCAHIPEIDSAAVALGAFGELKQQKQRLSSTHRGKNLAHELLQTKHSSKTPNQYHVCATLAWSVCLFV